MYGAPWSLWQEHLARYFGYMTLIDEQVGRIRAAVEQAGQLDNTLFVFGSDHGDMMGRHLLLDKGPVMYDETYRVPLVVRGPGVRQGECDDFVYLHDLFPTLLQAGGAEEPAGHDAQSLMPLLNGDGGWGSRDEIFGEFDQQICHFPQRMVRTRTHKFIFNQSDVCELYDLERDPHEMRNAVNDSDCQGVKEDLKERLLAHLRATRDPAATLMSAIYWAL